MCNDGHLGNHNELKDMSHGDHTCLIYEQLKDYSVVAVEYIKCGLNANEIVFCVIDEYDEDELIKDLINSGIDAKRYLKKGQLVISSIKNTYRGTDEFNPDSTLAFWCSVVEANKDCAGLRVMGEATFALDGRIETLEKLIDYEIRVNIDLLPIFKKHQYLCVYNKQLYPAGVLKSIIRAHPNYIKETSLSKPNPFFIEAKKYLEIHRSEVELYNEFQILDSNVHVNLEKELRRDEERFRYILGSIGDAVWDYDLIKNALFLSQNLLGKFKDESIEVKRIEDFEKYIHPEDYIKFREAINLFSQNKISIINDEFRLKGENNSWNWYECKGRPIGRSENGQNTRIVGTFQDIQLRKSIEFEKQNSRIILEEKIRERTSQLMKSNKALESFSYSVSHDLRAPLRSIDGFSLALLEDYGDKQDEEALHYIKRIRYSTIKMNQLINDLLELAKLSRNTPKIELIDLSEIIQNYITQYRESNQERNVRFIVQPNVKVPCDKGLISIVLTNLLDNALKFTQKHQHTTIEFGVKKVEDKDVYYLKDDGAGFDMKYVDKLFGIFQRLHRQDEYEGNGIGLATVQRIIHHHDGEIWAESEIEKGATFYFTLQMKGERNE